MLAVDDNIASALFEFVERNRFLLRTAVDSRYVELCYPLSVGPNR